VSQEIYDAALKHAQAARLTDAELIYTPSQIALACLSMSSPELAAEWLASKGAEGMAGVIEDIKTMIKRDGGIPSVDAVREVDRRLKLCKNPEKDPNSKAYQAKLAREKEQEDEKRNRKAEDARKAQTEEELFGSSLANAGDEDGGLDDDDDD
jgi:cyclin H